jgi:hypothetical protein
MFLGGKGGRYVGLTTLPPLCADCLETLEPSGPIQACNGIALPLPFTVLSITLQKTKALRLYYPKLLILVILN